MNYWISQKLRPGHIGQVTATHFKDPYFDVTFTRKQTHKLPPRGVIVAVQKELGGFDIGWSLLNPKEKTTVFNSTVKEFPIDTNNDKTIDRLREAYQDDIKRIEKCLAENDYVTLMVLKSNFVRNINAVDILKDEKKYQKFCEDLREKSEKEIENLKKKIEKLSERVILKEVLERKSNINWKQATELALKRAVEQIESPPLPYDLKEAYQIFFRRALRYFRMGKLRTQSTAGEEKI
jgi:hypothetical protein